MAQTCDKLTSLCYIILRVMYMVVTSKQMMSEAIELFTKYGYANVSINQICKEFGVTRGSFYNYFDSKEDLLIKWFDSFSFNIERIYDSAGGKNARERLYNIFMVWAQALSTIDPELLREYMIVSKNSLGTMFGKLNYDAAEDLILQAQVEGSISSAQSPQDLLKVYSFAVAGLSLWRDDTELPESFISSIALAFDIVFSAQDES